MTAFLAIAAWAWIGLAAVLAAGLLLEVLAGRRPAPPGTLAPGADVPSYAVLVPAHDEAGTVGPTVRAVLAQLPPTARLLVVADNCSDGTAAEARDAGAAVAERHDVLRRGKGHALAFGVAQLAMAPPQVVLVLDADCIPAPGALDLLAACAAATGPPRPVQALYLMGARPGSGLRVRMAAFAWAVKNQLRPLGLHRLGLPCQLMGSGMAFPWACIAGADLASGHLTEDLQLGGALAAAGHAPLFCPQARVESWFPDDGAALAAQRRRWEHGHLAMMPAALAALARAALARRSPAHLPAVLALALDLCIPPLALLALLLLAAAGLGAWQAAAGGLGWLAAAGAAGGWLCFAAAIVLAWRSVGRRWVSAAELACAPAYVLRKVPLYLAFALRRQKEWVRTGRQRG